jgi:putative hydrolase of HD superfamily
MDPHAALRILLHAQRLKQVPRTGWVLRGIPQAESVAEHSFGAAFTALVLAEMVEPTLDTTKVLTIALLHDLSESVTGDLPTPSNAHFPPGAKSQAETAILAELLAQAPVRERWQAWWCEFEERSSPEGRLVRDADYLDLLIQAYIYEQTTGNRWLGEFWPSSPPEFYFSATEKLYAALRRMRDGALAVDAPPEYPGA